MPPKVTPASRGWPSNENTRLSHIKLPEKVKCKNCHVKKENNQFSKKELTTLQKLIFDKGVGAAEAAYITCVKCGPKQITELQCDFCDETKGLDEFSKNQRSNPLPKCIACQETVSNKESREKYDDGYGFPGDSEAEEGSSEGNSSEEEDELHHSGDESEGVSLPETSSVLSGWVQQPRYGAPISKTASVSGTRPSTSTRSFNPSAYGRPAHAPAARPSLANNKSSSLSGNARSPASGSKWAKPIKPKQHTMTDEDDGWGYAKGSAHDQLDI